MWHLNPSLRSSFVLWPLSTIMLLMGLYLSMLDKTILIEWQIVSIGPSLISIPLIMDSTGFILSSVVLFISANVIFFSYSYMHEEMYLNRFIILVLLFVLSMNLLIFIPNLISLLIGWDGLGITSFALVIYYQNPKSLSAGMFTALSNRIGDVLILLSIALTLNQGHWNTMNMWPSSLSSYTIMLIMMAALTKSAQIPFSSWLPAAMAAPTPVSALVHSSTLVTAGVFLLIRFYPFLSSFPLFNKYLLIVSSLTMLMAGSAAMAEMDLKKIIALSTLSQLGVMMSSIALNLPNLALFHLMTHALFKALLFICAGTLINLNNHSQDLRGVGGLFNQMPLTLSCMIISKMALMGLPFMAGFYSKDMIIELMLFNSTNMIIITIYAIATLLTAAYSTRFLIMLLWIPNSFNPLHHMNDEDTYSSSAIILLSLGAIMGGSALNWVMFMPMSPPILPPALKFGTLFVVILGMILSYLAMNSNNFMNSNMLHFSLSSMWWITPSTTQMMLPTPMQLSHQSLKTLDHGWVEVIGAQGIMLYSSKVSNYMQNWQLSMITSHLSLIVLFSIAMLS